MISPLRRGLVLLLALAGVGVARADEPVDPEIERARTETAMVEVRGDTVYYTGSHPLVKDWIQPGTPRTASVTLRLDY